MTAATIVSRTFVDVCEEYHDALYKVERMLESVADTKRIVNHNILVKSTFEFLLYSLALACPEYW